MELGPVTSFVFHFGKLYQYRTDFKPVNNMLHGHLTEQKQLLLLTVTCVIIINNIYVDLKSNVIVGPVMNFVVFRFGKQY